MPLGPRASNIGCLKDRITKSPGSSPCQNRSCNVSKTSWKRFQDDLCFCTFSVPQNEPKLRLARLEKNMFSCGRVAKSRKMEAYPKECENGAPGMDVK